MLVVWILGTILFVVLPVAGGVWIVWMIRQEYRRDRVPILLYHRLIAKADADAGRVRDDEMIWVTYDTVFAEQMQYLADAGYETLGLDDYLAIRSGARPRPAKPIILTFDDGYESNYHYAFPALRKCGHKAVIFVALEPDDHTRQQVAGIDAFLTPEQMREMAAHGVSFQSHTLTHCILSELPAEKVRQELDEPRRRIAAITGHTVDHLAIPRAGGNRRVRQLAREAGYRTICGNGKGTASFQSNLVDLPRIVIERDMSVADFARALTPRAALMLRIVGNLKRIPERLGGASFARRVRNLLYRGPIEPLFETRNLKRVVLIVAVLYLVCCVWFVVAMIRQWTA
jgi:peptidoglycan/xylan/chitin deacetylase (PgdA/CDA1 family)